MAIVADDKDPELTFTRLVVFLLVEVLRFDSKAPTWPPRRVATSRALWPMSAYSVAVAYSIGLLLLLNVEDSGTSCWQNVIKRCVYFQDKLKLMIG